MSATVVDAPAPAKSARRSTEVDFDSARRALTNGHGPSRQVWLTGRTSGERAPAWAAAEVMRRRWWRRHRTS